MKKVIVFGDLPIATKIVMFLQTLPDIEIGVVIGNKSPNNHDPWDDIPLLIDYCELHPEISLFSLYDIENKFDRNELTLGLSCRFSKIIKEDVLDKFKFGILNTHGGLNPEFGGLFSANHTILQGSKIGGGTIHYIDTGIDTGEIVKRCEFEVTDVDTAFSIFQKTQEALESGLEEVIPLAINGYINNSAYDEKFFSEHNSRYFNKNSLEGLREINFSDMSFEEISRKIRGFDFPGYEPAYFIDKNGRKVYMRYHY